MFGIYLVCILMGIGITVIFMYRKFKRIVESGRNFKVRGKWYRIIKREDLDEL